MAYNRLLRGNAVLEQAPVVQQGRSTCAAALAWVVTRLDRMGELAEEAEARIEAIHEGKVDELRALDRPTPQSPAIERQPQEFGNVAALIDEEAPEDDDDSSPTLQDPPQPSRARPSTDELLKRAKARDGELEKMRRDAEQAVRAGVEHRQRITDSLGDLYDAVHEFHRWRAKRMAARRASFLAHTLLLAAFGLLVGVFLVNWAADWVDNTSATWVATGAFAVMSWALLGYVLTPSLERLLIRRQVRLLMEEAASTHIAWVMLRARVQVYDLDALPLFQDEFGDGS